MRRTMLPTALVAVVMLTGWSASAAPLGEVNGRFDRPQPGFAPEETMLREGTPEDVGLDPRPIDAALSRIAAWTEKTPDREHPMYGGAVSLLTHDGVVVKHDAVGRELRYADDKGKELPSEQQEPMERDTIFDVASITKLFTSIAVLQQVEDGALALKAPVAKYLPEFAVNGKQSITVEQLLTHTSGLQSEVQLWKLPPDQRIPSVMALTPEKPPGTAYNYSDPNMITLGVLIERVTGDRLDKVVQERISTPLGLRDTGYNPPAHKLHRIAATEFQTDPPRGMLRGQPHDENAWALGGVAGQAGVFSTAHDLALLGQTLVNGGVYRGERILDEDSVQKMWTNYNAEFPGNSHGLGFELDQRWYMAGLSSPRTAGHTGYTGTSIVLDPASRSVAVLLTNRVHPSRTWGSSNPSRIALAQGLAESLAVRPVRGPDEWFTGPQQRPATLMSDNLGEVSDIAKLSFNAFVDTQNDADGADRLTVEASVDNGASWQPLTLMASGPGAPQGPQKALAGAGHRAWWKVRGSFRTEPGKKVQLRWNYTPNEEYAGRGVFVDGITVTDRDGVLLDGERHPERLRPDGWVSTNR